MTAGAFLIFQCENDAKHSQIRPQSENVKVGIGGGVTWI